MSQGMTATVDLTYIVELFLASRKMTPNSMQAHQDKNDALQMQISLLSAEVAMLSDAVIKIMDIAVSHNSLVSENTKHQDSSCTLSVMDIIATGCAPPPPPPPPCTMPKAMFRSSAVSTTPQKPAPVMPTHSSLLMEQIRDAHCKKVLRGSESPLVAATDNLACVLVSSTSPPPPPPPPSTVSKLMYRNSNVTTEKPLTVVPQKPAEALPCQSSLLMQQIREAHRNRASAEDIEKQIMMRRQQPPQKRKSLANVLESALRAKFGNVSRRRSSDKGKSI